MVPIEPLVRRGGRLGPNQRVALAALSTMTWARVRGREHLLFSGSIGKLANMARKWCRANVEEMLADRHGAALIATIKEG